MTHRPSTVPSFAGLPLIEFPKRHDFLLCLDSDGCVFNTMEIKQKRCIIPNLIRYWGLEAVEPQARLAAEWVNLYSRHRGINRWPALIVVLDLLAKWPEVRVPVPRAARVRDWIARETRWSNDTLRAAVEASGDPELALALGWSEAVNRAISMETRGIQPFPAVREALNEVSRWADIVVCSTTSQEALEREWREGGVEGYASGIAGQEMGVKADLIRGFAGGRYASERVLMVGDAPGDLEAARVNGARFFPIRPGAEVESWRLLAAEFSHWSYDAERERGEVERFLALLPETPPWKQG